MATIRLAMSATSPGATTPDAWDAHWTGLVTSYAGVNASSVSYSGAIDGTHTINTVAVGGGTLFQIAPAPAVSIFTQTLGGLSTQSITMNASWNTIKDIELTNLDTNITKISNFVDTWVSAATDNANRTIAVEGAKRGDISLGDGNDNVSVSYMSNDVSWSNLFYVTLGNGNDTVTINPEKNAAIAATLTQAGWVFNQTPQATMAIISLGNGNDNVTLDTSGNVQFGSGDDSISLVDGVHVVYLGSGNDNVQISSHDLSIPATMAFSTQRDIDNVYIGSGHTTISIDDTAGVQTPLTNLFFSRANTGGATPDVISYGHTNAATGQFVGGDWSALTLYLSGYAPGSTAALAPGGSAGVTLLEIQDALSGGVDVLTLHGAAPANISALHLYFT
jgi:hypothetical protein